MKRKFYKDSFKRKELVLTNSHNSCGWGRITRTLIKKKKKKPDLENINISENLHKRNNNKNMNTDES